MSVESHKAGMLGSVKETRARKTAASFVYSEAEERNGRGERLGRKRRQRGDEEEVREQKAELMMKRMKEDFRETIFHSAKFPRLSH